ncbi:hypothetical protein LSTR_LSTR013114 [Laodelphax striatellus]|uniref:Uncharacterized protein n=1 Tax=Laodelphax striatellus TaxID=195883 RepID=A0A482WQ91_LAOST|nr:hypothetical protein LSTR_LSTR013114 [Laodelphax striatellus]
MATVWTSVSIRRSRRRRWGRVGGVGGGGKENDEEVEEVEEKDEEVKEEEEEEKRMMRSPSATRPGPGDLLQSMLCHFSASDSPFSIAITSLCKSRARCLGHRTTPQHRPDVSKIPPNTTV